MTADLAKPVTAPEAQQTTDLVEYVSAAPTTVLMDDNAFEKFCAVVRDHIARHEPDTSTDAGRKAIASLAYKITRSKSALENASKDMTEEYRKKVDAVNAKRRRARNELDALAAEARRPLTEWEEAEEKRAKAVSSAYGLLAKLEAVPAGESAAEIADRIAEAEAIETPADLFGAAHNVIVSRKADVLGHLRNLHERAEQAEAERKELERLRAEKEAREAAEREAEERAKAEEEARKREAEAAERARAEERERQEREAREAAAAEERRAANRRHVSAVMRKAKEAIMAHGVAEDTAKSIVQAIRSGEIPNVSIRF